MLKKPVHFAPVLALLLMWPGLFQSVHRVKHHFPAPIADHCCHHHCPSSQEEKTNKLVIEEMTQCFVCDFEFALYQAVQFKGNLNSIKRPSEKLVTLNTTFYHISETLHLRLRAPPPLV